MTRITVLLVLATAAWAEQPPRREKKGGTDLSEKTEPWAELPGFDRSSVGDFEYKLTGLAQNRLYEFRTRVRHPLITMYGEEKTFRTRAVTRH